MSFIQFPSFEADGSIGWDFRLRTVFGPAPFEEISNKQRDKLYTDLRSAATAGKWRRSRCVFHSNGASTYYIVLKRYNTQWVYETYKASDGCVVETVAPALPEYIHSLILETNKKRRTD